MRAPAASLASPQRRIALFLFWTAVAVALIPFATDLESRLDGRVTVAGAEAARAQMALAHEFDTPLASPTILVVEGLAPTQRPRDAETLRGLVEMLETAGSGIRVISHLDAGDPLFLGADTSGAVLFVSAPGAPLADLQRIADSYVASAGGELALHWTSESLLNNEIREISARDANEAELRVLPLALIVLLIAFGSATAGATPVAIGFLTVALARGLLALIDIHIPLSILTANVATMLGLALSVDYALLVVSRFRDELMHAGQRTAARVAAQRAGGAVLLSGAGVAIALAALLLVPISEVRSIGIAGLVVVIVAVAICTTLLPALLAIAGSRIDLLWPLRRRLAPASRSLWNRWARLVFARPLVLAICTAAPLLALAFNCARLDISLPRGEWMPRSTHGSQAMAALARMERKGLLQTIHVVVRFEAPVASPSSWRALAQLAERYDSDPRVEAARSITSVTGPQNAAVYPFLPSVVRRMFVSHDQRSALIAVIPRAGLELHECTQLVRDLRAVSPPAGVAAIDIGGAPALTADYIAAVTKWFAPVAGAILAATFIVLTIGLGSVLLPLKAVALNLLSVGAALGAMVLVFQDGHGAQWLGLQGPAHAVFPILPILVFSVVFGLSMDYEVFLFSRVVEAHRAGQDDISAMTAGLRATAGVITSAAVLMVIVFGAFVLGEFLLMKMLGFSLAVAILIDAVLVRLVLGPALFAIAGRWNWWPYPRAFAADAAAVKP